ncbi:MAG TPA: hypothetical protein VMO47_14360 [Rhodothermales bacterium]|nr:hypothetical protein [Rhodothermales bacterium]
MQPGIYFQKAREAHAFAVERAGSIDYHLSIAGRRVRLVFASELLSKQLTPALMHRVSEPSTDNENLTLLAWDTAATGVRPPSPPWGPDDYLARGQVRGFNEDGVRTAFHVGVNVLSLFEHATATAVFWTPDASTLPDWQIGSPFLAILHWWTEAADLDLVHAGAVGTSDAGALLVGPGGSGKSTTSLACAGSSGLRFVSDDYCLLESTGGDRAHSLFNSAKLDDHSLNLLPRFRSGISNRGVKEGRKDMVFLAEHAPVELADSVPIKVILLPRPSNGGVTQFRPASSGEALRALAPSTIFQLSGAGRRSFKRLGALVRRVPSFHLDLSRDMRDTAAVVRSILEGLA